MKNGCFKLVSGLVCSEIEQMKFLPLGKHHAEFSLWGDAGVGGWYITQITWKT